MQRSPPVLAALMALAGCTATTTEVAAPSETPATPAGWRGEVSDEDVARIERLPATWRAVLMGLPMRYAKDAAREGDLLVADAGRDHPTPPPGSYRCRLIKIGPNAAKGVPLRNFPDFFCYIRPEPGGALTFVKQTGTDLPGGWLRRDGDSRMILIGARQHAAGDTSLAYGKEPDRDVVGVIERIGPFRWRLTLPWRTEPEGLDVYEMTPVPMEQQAEEPRVAHATTEVEGAEGTP